MLIGVRVFEDNVAEMDGLDVDYFELRVNASYSKGRKKVPATNIRAFDRIKDKVIGIHGAIQDQEVNLMNKERNNNNVRALKTVMAAAASFDKCKYIIMHPGRVESGYEEDCGFKYLYGLMEQYYDPRLCLEFVPIFSCASREVFPMHSVDDFKRLKDKTGKEIVLDIGHAAITARAMGYDMVEYMSRLIEELGITVVHVADNAGSGDGYHDSHMHIGEGNIPIEQIIRAHKDRIEFATLEVNGVNARDIAVVRSWL